MPRYVRVSARTSVLLPDMIASGTTAAAGLAPAPPFTPGAAKYLREDATWATPSGGGGTPASTVTTSTSFGQSSAVGTGTDYARNDHVHGTPTAPTAASVGALAATASASGDLGGNFPGPTVAAVHETSGPTQLVLGAVPALSVLTRNSGASVVGVPATSDETMLIRRGGALVWVPILATILALDLSFEIPADNPVFVTV